MLDILITIHKNVVRASQASILANIYASMCKTRTPERRKHYNILHKAIEEHSECVITLEPLTYASVVTSCGHVFSKEGLQSWIRSRSNAFDCPLCKQSCSIVFP